MQRDLPRKTLLALLSTGLALAVVSGLAAAQAAPEGFRNFASKAKGITAIYPMQFEELPVPPGEEWIQVKFTEKRATAPDAKFLAQIWILRIEKGSVETGAAPAPAEPEPEPEPAPEPKEGAKPEPKKEAPKKIEDFASFAARRMPQWKFEKDRDVDGGRGKTLEQYSMRLPGSELKGLAWVSDQGTEYACLVGIAHRSRLEDLEPKFARSARSLALGEADDALHRDVELHYKLHPFRDVEYRKQVRRNLAKGWKAEDTENFILVYDTNDKILLSKLKNDLEVVRTKFIEFFPPVKEIEAVSTVRVCKTKEEFHQFSGVQGNVAGFWNVGTKELVFYNAASDPSKSQAQREDSYVVLYHEAFHQYIYYSCGEIAPHSWFNEGYGDYFSGCQIGARGRKVDRIGVNPWRVGTVQKMVLEGDYAPLEKLVRFEQPDYYAKGGFYYAQGWALIYFLNESKTAERHAVWSKILPTYFDVLTSTYRDEIAKLGDDAPQPKKFAAQQAAKKAAVDAAFEKVDYAELETAWKEFVGTLKDPRKR